MINSGHALHRRACLFLSRLWLAAMSRQAVVVAVIAGLLLAGVWYGATRGPNPVEIVPPGRGDVAAIDGYVGAVVCMECHADIARAYRTSGHAHTFHATNDSQPAWQLANVTFDDPQRKRPFRYHFDREGLSVSLPDQFGDEQFPLMYAVGSGTHAVTFLTLLPHRDGGVVGLEHRATLYSQLHGLGLTVGHRYLAAPVEDAEHFGKVLDRQKLTECIGCHTTHAKLNRHEITELIPHVGCEKCHGPGHDHVAARRAGRPGPEFSPARRWPSALDEIRTCGACHRMPETLKPSELTRGSRVLPRFQPAGLMQSLCFTRSKGELRCTTCHDPHAKTSTDTAAYERVCQSCHQRQSVQACPKGATGCVACHMPPVAFEEVAAFHDHWIRVRNSPEDPEPAVVGETGEPK